jgi:hypothetical protein
MAGGGERLRIRLTNRYGRTPLTIAAATAATEHGQAALTFDGRALLPALEQIHIWQQRRTPAGPAATHP